MNLESPLPMVLKCSALRVRPPPSCLSSSTDQGRARTSACYLHERLDSLGREIVQHLGVLADPHRVDRVHAYGVHRRVGHDPESVHDRLAELLAHGTHQLLAVTGRLPAVAAAQRDDGSCRAAARGARAAGGNIQERHPRWSSRRGGQHSSGRRHPAPLPPSLQGR